MEHSLEFRRIELPRDRGVCETFRRDSFACSFKDPERFERECGKDGSSYIDWLTTRMAEFPAGFLYVWRNGDIMLGRGRESARTFLRENPTVMEEITRKILEPRNLLHLLGSATSSQAPEPASAPAETEAPASRKRRTSAASAASANNES